MGNDSLSGGVGDDFLFGGAGIDTLAGASSIDFGDGSIDILTGGSESDLFILGASSGVFYDSDQVNSPASTDYAEITDFDFSQDGIRLTGVAINYSLVEGMVPNTGLSGTSIYLAGQTNELIGVVTEVTGLDLNASYFSYV